MFASFFLHFGSRKIWPSMSACLIIAWHHPCGYNLKEKTYSKSDTHCTHNIWSVNRSKTYWEPTVWSLSRRNFFSTVLVLPWFELERSGLQTTSSDVLFPISLKGRLSEFTAHFPPALGISHVAGTDLAVRTPQAQGLQLHFVWLELNLQTTRFLLTSSSVKVAFNGNFLSMMRENGEDQLR